MIGVVVVADSVVVSSSKVVVVDSPVVDKLVGIVLVVAGVETAVDVVATEVV